LRPTPTIALDLLENGDVMRGRASASCSTASFDRRCFSGPERDSDRHAERDSNRHAERDSNRHAERDSNRHAERDSNRHAERDSNRHAERGSNAAPSGVAASR
jgi:hypothetical protein